MGMSEPQVAVRVELPLAAPTIMTGVRTAAINIIATATIAPLVGVLTLGDFILARNVYGDEGVLAGAILVALLASTVELALAGGPAAADAARVACSAAAQPRAVRIGLRRASDAGRCAQREEEPPDEHDDPRCACCWRCSPSFALALGIAACGDDDDE